VPVLAYLKVQAVAAASATIIGKAACSSVGEITLGRSELDAWVSLFQAVHGKPKLA